MSEVKLHPKEKKRIAAQISKRRVQLIIHRYLYYVKSATLITDATYDQWERELKELCAAHPDIANSTPYSTMCPSRVIGSSNADDYPRAIEQIAESLLANAPIPSS